MKKVKRRILASLMTLAMIFQMMPAVAFAAGSLWGGGRF